MHGFFKRQGFIFITILVFGAGITLLSGLYTNFHVAGNDFWGVLYYGRHITLEQKESLYNGFFPIGYAFLIGQFPYTYVIQLAYLTNALLAGLFVASVSSLVAASRSISAIIFVLITSVTAPFVFIYSNSVGPDIGAATFSAFAIYLLWKDELTEFYGSDSKLRSILTGVSLGLAVLWRTHAIVIAMSILAIAIWLLGIHPLRSRVLIILSFLMVVSIQIIANVVSGHGALETAQNFNIYKFVYGVDWTYPPSPAEIAGFSLLDVLREDPRRLLDAYLPFFQGLASYAWPGLVCFLIAPKGGVKNYGLFSALVTILYAVPLALGDSPRAPLTIMSLYIPSMALILVALRERFQSSAGSVKWVPAVLTLAFFAVSANPIYQWAVQDWEFLQENHAQNRVFNSIEGLLLTKGVTSPTQAYADKYELYFPHTLPYQARQIGGWSIEWLWGYATEYPVLPNDSWESFRQACREQRIEYLIISPQATYQGEFFKSIYDEEIDEASWGLEFIARRANMKIYRIK
jgi:hypothetical protein